MTVHPDDRTTDQQRHDQGMAVRRTVLGDAHVDGAEASTSS
ncbi:MAG TPA: gamma-carboxymuconolactone decarboxylase, partial [Terrimesophilobacter sp.]|nr:gamma-carboxymuconolactone decarboxylase [Terrimesophilobacter sp.]